MSKNYLIGKIGKAIIFNSDNWSDKGGDNEASILFSELAKSHPEDNFYLISSAAYYKNNIPNLISLYADKSPKYTPDDYLIEKLKDIKIDGILLLTGPTSAVNIPNMIYTLETVDTTKTIYKCLDVFRIYVSQIYRFLNDCKLPWLLLAHDNRFIKQGRDLINTPIKCLTQCDTEIKAKKIISYEDQHTIEYKLKCFYYELEKTYLLNNSIIIPKNKTKKIILICSKTISNIAHKKYNMIYKYILEWNNDVEIYGDWNGFDKAENDNRFKGSIPFSKVNEIISSSKYTFIISEEPIMVTSKYVETIAQGCLPFFHPEYDIQKHCDVPDFLRVKSPKDLRDKIDLLESDNKMYEELLADCQNRLRKFNKKEFLDNILAQVPMCNKPGKNLETVNSNIEEW